MDDYISRQEALDKDINVLSNDCIVRQTAMNAFAEYVKRSNNSDFAPTPTWNDAVEIVENLPSADVQPVRHGRWIDKDGGIATCSECGERWGVWSVMNYCPSCGATMDGEQNDDVGHIE